MSSLKDRYAMLDSQHARLLDINTLIAWAETKPHGEMYDYGDVGGNCFFSQFLNEHGLTKHNEQFNPNPGRELWYALHALYKDYINRWINMPTTFGNAVLRLKYGNREAEVHARHLGADGPRVTPSPTGFHCAEAQWQSSLVWNSTLSMGGCGMRHGGYVVT